MRLFGRNEFGGAGTLNSRKDDTQYAIRSETAQYDNTSCIGMHIRMFESTVCIYMYICICIYVCIYMCVCV